jgi:hypothetical protein
MLPTVVDPHNSQQACDRMLDAIAAVFLSLKKRPVIRYERSSEIARRVAQDAAVSGLTDILVSNYCTKMILCFCKSLKKKACCMSTVKHRTKTRKKKRQKSGLLF